MLETGVARKTRAMLTTATVVLLMATPALAQTAPPAPDVGNWKVGDVHVHAAGDSGLEPHIRCDDTSGTAACARRLVRQTLDRADDNGLDWLIYTEHVPWLGMHETTKVFCPIPGLFCGVVPWIGHDASQAARQFDALKAATEREAPGYHTRPLTGQELGTAAQASIPLGLIGNEFCPTTKAGHFGVYYLPDSIDDRWDRCVEERYLRDVEGVGGWGAVNHPDNPDGGSRWYCWQEGRLREGPVAPDCVLGVTEMPHVARAIELVNDRNMPSVRSLLELDNLLMQGQRVALVGGGDAHTSRPDGDFLAECNVGPIEYPCANSELGRQQQGNDGKIGVSGRTYARIAGAVEPLPGHESDLPYDRVRNAISGGRTVASTAPLALPTIDGREPGDTYVVTGDHVIVRVDLRSGRAGTGDGVIAPSASMPTRLVDHAERINVTVGNRDGCELGTTPSTCPERPSRRSYSVDADDRARGYKLLHVPVDEEITSGYLRTEVLYDLLEEGNDRYPFGQKYRDGSFSSPIYLTRRATGTGALDLIFAIDTTGSMFDDIDAVREAAASIVDQIAAAGGDFRVGVVTYKDHPVSPYGDPTDFPSRIDLPFSRDPDAIIDAIRAIDVGGGNDWPESVLSGLKTAIDFPWRPGVKKAIVLLGDAPPHDPEPFTGLTSRAVIDAALAVDPAEIYPVTVGGDQDAASAFQVLAQGTGGQSFPARNASEVVGSIVDAVKQIGSGPVASLGRDAGGVRGFAGESLTLSAAESYDPDGRIVEYAWDLDGDGTYDELTTEPTITHTYSSAFSGQVWLRVTDDDGLANVAWATMEVAAVNPDPDDDGLATTIETQRGTDPRNPDSDADGLLDGREVHRPQPTDPRNPDTDGDGLLDGSEDRDADGTVDPGETDPLVADTDGDGVSDGNERLIGLDPRDTDSDGDGVPDGSETAWLRALIETLADGEQLTGTPELRGGRATGLLARLDVVDRHVADGKPARGVHELGQLRKAADGCGSKAAADDAVLRCSAQGVVTAEIDRLVRVLR